MEKVIYWCQCTEGRYVSEADGKEYPTGLYGVHSCTYVAWRNSLIPIAEKMALKECPDLIKVDPKTKGRIKERDPRYCREFHRTMERLVAERK